uniref:Major Facilitator Superfamily protein n=1 Tax=Musca domestica TaxID=7370 RepID=A0A1I8MBK9_MUSDO
MEKQPEKRENCQSVYNETTKANKPKRRDKSDLGPNFIAPDGGWGWVVCMAAGLSNLSLFPALMQYGLVYRERMTQLEFDAKQIATIINAMLAISSLVGLVNGAMFRSFSFRQVGMAGSVMVFTGVLLTVFCETFIQYMLCYSTIYGIGLGLTMSANALAVNVYFENKRRKATGFSWTITGLGPIILPYITIFLLDVYGAQGTILVYAGISLNTFMCSLTLQPVQRHVPKAKVGPVTEVNRPHEIFECEYCQCQRKRKRSIFSGDYLYKDGEDLTTPGYEIIETGTPIKAGANDGWFGSKISLTNANTSRQRASKLLRQISQQDSVGKGVGFQEHEPQSSLYQPNNFHRERKVSTKSMADGVHCTCAEGQRLLQNLRLEELAKEHHLVKEEEQEEELRKNRLTLLQKIIVFFDLDLLKDVTFINLVVGMTIMIFGEVNFSLL